MKNINALIVCLPTNLIPSGVQHAIQKAWLYAD
jgi:hypothetical protein